jgi:hypothetical protein
MNRSASWSNLHEYVRSILGALMTPVCVFGRFVIEKTGSHKGEQLTAIENGAMDSENRIRPRLERHSALDCGIKLPMANSLEAHFAPHPAT